MQSIKQDCFLVGELLAAINRDFGSFNNLVSNLSAATTAVQGSGWGWLVCCYSTCHAQ